MKLTVLGGTGRIGRLVVAQALAARHDVTVLVRDPQKLGSSAERVQVVRGSVSEAAAVVGYAVAGADAVISALGPDGNTADQVVALRDGMHRLSSSPVDVATVSTLVIGAAPRGVAVAPRMPPERRGEGVGVPFEWLGVTDGLGLGFELGDPDGLGDPAGLGLGDPGGIGLGDGHAGTTAFRTRLSENVMR